jgi:hypothetical protein
MTADDLICDLRSWIQARPQPKNESEFHDDIFGRLKIQGLVFDNKKRIKNPGTRGVSIPDMLVTSVTPQLLIEVKANGGWRCVSEAAWQLYQADELLQGEGTVTRKLAIFGSKLTDPILCKMLGTLGIESACVQV